MPQTELDSFVQKFHQLWNNGYNAQLDLDTNAGQAYVGLREQLGHVQSPHQTRKKIRSWIFEGNWR